MAVEREVLLNLTEVGGRLTNDLGLGRIVGRVAVYSYLVDRECSLDTFAEELGLSKASVSIAARQLESLGVLQKVSKKGKRKDYYRIVDHLALALQRNLAAMVRAKIEFLGMELSQAETSLKAPASSTHGPGDRKRILRKVERARNACSRLQKILDSPLLGLLKKRR